MNNELDDIYENMPKEATRLLPYHLAFWCLVSFLAGYMVAIW